jgi:GNAT superfamily N-acetyltransferase
MMSLNNAEILALYDKEQRRDVEFFDTRREALAHVVRHTSRPGGDGFVIYSNLVGADMESVVREQIAHFASINQDFEWKVYSHDAPVELGPLLARLGFEEEPEETIVYLDLSAMPESLSACNTANVERIFNPRDVDEICTIMTSAGNKGFSRIASSLKAELVEDAEHIGIYVARKNGVPASAGWIRFHEKSCFAGLWGGATLPAWRRQGLYSALVAARAAEASRRGVRYITVDAAPTSRPILEKFGFQALTRARAYVWHNPTTAAQ